MGNVKHYLLGAALLIPVLLLIFFVFDLFGGSRYLITPASATGLKTKIFPNGAPLDSSATS